LDARFAAGAAWMKGQIIPIADAMMSVNDWELFYSDITYDVVPVWEGGLFRFSDDLDRFHASMTALHLDPMCLIPRFDGAICSLEWKEALWDRYVTAAPRLRTLSELQYSDRKLQPRR
jgi:branched-chain amino acid aminotransferase